MSALRLGTPSSGTSPGLIGVIALAASLSVLLLTVQVWHVVHSFDVVDRSFGALETAENRRDALVDLEHHLLHAADMLAQTGASPWAAELSSRQSALVAGMETLADEVSALSVLVRTRQRVADLAAAGDLATARAAVQAPDYLQASADLLAAIEAHSRQVGEALQADLADARRNELASLTLAAAVFCVTVVVWIVLAFRERRARLAVASEAAQRLVIQRELSQARKLESVGRMASGIAHDIGNLVAAIAGDVSLARRALAAESASRAPLDRIDAAASQMRAVVASLVACARQRPLSRQPVDVCDLVQRTATLLRGMLPADIRLHLDLAGAPGATVLGDATMLQQAVCNLVLNARDAMPSGGDVSIVARGRQGEVEIAVVDDGTGIDPAVCETLFEPFVTTRRHQGGSGLGLALVEGVIAEHGGRIVVDSAAGRGTTIHLRLPSAPSPVSRPRSAVSPLVRGAVGVASDDRLARELVAGELAESGFEVVQIAEASALGGSTGEVLPLVVLAPFAGTPEAAAAFAARRSAQAPVLLVIEPGVAVPAGTAVRIVAKPLDLERIVDEVDRILPPRPVQECAA